MRNIIKKFVKPPLEKVGIYKHIYRFYFYILNIKTRIKNRIIKNLGRSAPVLLYHRISEVSDDPLMLCVTPNTFENHLIFLNKNYKVIPLLELSMRIKNNTLSGNEVSLTFDDGYKDNLDNALPLLEKYNTPATIFIATSLLGKKASYKWDLKYKETDRATFLSREEIKKISKHRLIEIGGHTHTHRRLSDLDFEEQRKEILRNKEILENITEDKIRLFAYPFGGKLDFNNDSKKILRKLKFSFAYSNTGLLADQNSSTLSIPRINIREISKDELAKKILTKH